MAKKRPSRLTPWLHDYLRRQDPELGPSLVRAMDAFEETQQTKRLTPEALAAIVEAASSSRRPLYENACSLLRELSGRFADARKAIESMACDARAHVRFNAILCLGKPTPRRLTLKLLRQGLEDKSAKVRQKAADWAGRVRYGEIVPDLESAVSRERDRGVKGTMQFELQLLRDGYIVEPDEEGYVTVTTHIEKGVSTRWVSPGELKKRGLKAIVAEMVKDRSSLLHGS